MAVPIVAGAVARLGDQHRPTPLGQKQKGETGADLRIGLDVVVPLPKVLQLILAGQQHFAAHPVPVVALPVAAVKKAVRGHSPHSFQAVEVIHHPGRGAAGIGLHREIVAQPGQPAFDGGRGGIFLVIAAALQRAVDDFRIAGIQPILGHHQRSDAGAGHAAGAVQRKIIPGAVAILHSQPILLGQFPGAFRNRYAYALRFVQGEHRELGVGIVAAADFRAVRPGTLFWPLLILRILQPLHVAADDQQILLRLGHAQHHRLQRDDVGLFRRQTANVRDGPRHGIAIRRLAGRQQRQGAQRGHSAGIIDVIRPGAVLALRMLQVVDAPFDGAGAPARR